VVADNLEAENISDLSIKGIDLESAVAVKGPPIDYSAEACPPEFAAELKAGRGLDFQVQYNYDIWSYGILLYELAVGRSIWGGKSDGAITTQLVSPAFDVDVSAVPDAQLRSLIQGCLSLEPNKRPGITQILLHPYFLTTGIGSISF
jgi:serine/threonine protein kinase